MKLYDLVKRLLETHPSCRENSKELVWQVWRYGGYVNNSGDSIHKKLYMVATSPESILRARRKVVELHPDLGPIKTKGKRDEKLKTKGTFIFRELL